MVDNPVIDWSKQPVEFWQTETYLICAYRNHCNEIGLLAIRRHDWKPCSDWRDKQAIKNQIVGPEREAVELYPAESRVQDTANWYWLCVLPPGEQFCLGFFLGTNRLDKAGGHEVQRPLAQRGDASSLERCAAVSDTRGAVGQFE
jgi:hypothetical protein